MFNNVEINKSLEKDITAQLTHAPKEKAILKMSKPNECLHKHQRQNTCKHKSYCKQFIFCLKLCKQFIMAFQALQTIYFQISYHPPAPEK